MFAADLSWSDHGAKTVGQHKQRSRNSSEARPGSTRSFSSLSKERKPPPSRAGIQRQESTATHHDSKQWQNTFSWGTATEKKTNSVVTSRASRPPPPKSLKSMKSSNTVAQVARDRLPSMVGSITSTPTQDFTISKSFDTQSYEAPRTNANFDPFAISSVHTVCYSDAGAGKKDKPSIKSHFRTVSKELKNELETRHIHLPASLSPTSDEFRFSVLPSNPPQLPRYESSFTGSDESPLPDEQSLGKVEEVPQYESPAPSLTGSGPRKSLHDQKSASEWNLPTAPSSLWPRRSEQALKREGVSALPMPGAAAALDALQRQQMMDDPNAASDGSEDEQDDDLDQLSFHAATALDLHLGKEGREASDNSSAASTLVSSPSSLQSPIGSFPSDRFESFVQDLDEEGMDNFLKRMQAFQARDGARENPEVDLERQLWVLTALELRSLDPYEAPTDYAYLRHCPLTSPRKILELDGSPAQVYQLAAMFPKARKYYLSARPRDSFPLPSNTITRRISPARLLPLPYASGSMDFIRCSNLPALVPASQLVAALDECHRCLKDDGVLEIRVIDPLPNTLTTGHKMRDWAESNLSVNLDMNFRCTRPSILLPQWLAQAGFKVRTVSSAADAYSPRLVNGPDNGARTLAVPAACADRATADDEVAMLVGRELWKDVWGTYVGKCTGRKDNWWWDDEAIVKECQKKRTLWTVTTLWATKH